MAAVQMVVAAPSAKVVERVGTKLVVATGLTVAATGLVLASRLSPAATYPQLLVALVVLSAGLAVVMPPATESIMGSLPPGQGGCRLGGQRHHPPGGRRAGRRLPRRRSGAAAGRGHPRPLPAGRCPRPPRRCGPDARHRRRGRGGRAAPGGFTVDAVAARAGVGKATVYRRWTSRAAPLLDTARHIGLEPSALDTGSLRDDLVGVLVHQATKMRASASGRKPGSPAFGGRRRTAPGGQLRPDGGGVPRPAPGRGGPA